MSPCRAAGMPLVGEAGQAGRPNSPKQTRLHWAALHCARGGACVAVQPHWAALHCARARGGACVAVSQCSRTALHRTALSVCLSGGKCAVPCKMNEELVQRWDGTGGAGTCVSLMAPCGPRPASPWARGPSPRPPAWTPGRLRREADGPSVCPPRPLLGRPAGPRGPFSEPVLLPLRASSRTLPAQVNHYPGSVWSARQWAWRGGGAAAATAGLWLVLRRAAASLYVGVPLPSPPRVSLVLFTCQAAEWNFARGRSAECASSAPRPPCRRESASALGRVNGRGDLNLTLYAPRPTC